MSAEDTDECAFFSSVCVMRFAGVRPHGRDQGDEGGPLLQLDVRGAFVTLRVQGLARARGRWWRAFTSA